MARLRVVTKEGEAADQTFEEAARGAMERVLAERPGGVCIIYESAEKVSWETVPNMDSLTRGLIETAMDVLNEPIDE